eukprot:CAMPEP_0170564688 /NCGR_PEP_ID=MMETSP0211-20121228/74325_1 /TAXON_ID=311385 /ORGANISM="Pseudokeronopsis sp., Strain OXSARD2" /LENGTH=76 /DNA_ID=CAMNT_0010884467 /DNA_START=368 /DNA_END=598 /DNA_ORIENTATION=+
MKREKRPQVTLKSGDTYEGEWDTETNTKDGFGLLCFKNGDVYQGYFEQDKFHGRGRLREYYKDSSKMSLTIHEGEF